MPDDLIDTVFGAGLCAVGFEKTRARKWVRGTKAPIREILEFSAMKGASYSARWGFSMDFVPLYLPRARRLRWKHTNKSCELDLCIDPVDETGRISDLFSFVHMPVYLESTIANVSLIREPIWTLAGGDFSRINSVNDLTELFEERSRMKFRRFSLDNYIQTHLAWGVALHALGKRDEGDEHLSLFCRKHGIDRNNRILLQAIDAARQLT